MRTQSSTARGLDTAQVSSRSADPETRAASSLAGDAPAAAAVDTQVQPQVRPLRFREMRGVTLVMLLADVVAAEAALALGYLVREMLLPWLPLDMTGDVWSGIALGILLIPALNWMYGLYPGYCVPITERVRRRTIAFGIGALMLFVWDYVVQGGVWSRGILIVTLISFMFFAPLATMLARRLLIRMGCWGLPVFILGAGDTGTVTARHLREEVALGLVPVAFFDDNRFNRGTDVMGVPVVGPVSLASSEELARAARVAIIAMPSLGRAALVKLVEAQRIPRVMVIPDLSGMQSAWVSARDLGGTLALEINQNLLVDRTRRVKRAIDVVVGGMLWLASLPVLGVCALMIKIMSPGPAFYEQERSGFGGAPFKMRKLRTMHLDAEARLAELLRADPEARAEWMKFFKLRNDPRVISWLGHLLRRTSLDELPQLWQVVRGEMSLVGPRPFPDYHLAEFSSEFHDLRNRVRPGLTGLWQVEVRSGGGLDVQQTLDTYYIRNWSIWLDLHIVLRTFNAVFMARGAY